MRVKPVRNCIYVLPDKIVDKTESGIILSDYTKKRPTSGTIIATGPEVKDFKEGQRIIYGQFSGAKCIFKVSATKEVELFIMTEEDILAVEDCG